MQCNKPIDPDSPNTLAVYAWIEGLSETPRGLLHDTCLEAWFFRG